MIAQTEAQLRQTRTAGLGKYWTRLKGRQGLGVGCRRVCPIADLLLPAYNWFFGVGVAIGIGYRQGIILPFLDSDSDGDTDGDLNRLTFVV